MNSLKLLGSSMDLPQSPGGSSGVSARMVTAMLPDW